MGIGRRGQTRTMRMSLLGGFQLENEGAELILPEGSQRLLAFLALKGRSIRRPLVAGTLWPVATEDHASSSLRSALARLQGGARAAVATEFSDSSGRGRSSDSRGRIVVGTLARVVWRETTSTVARASTSTMARPRSSRNVTPATDGSCVAAIAGLSSRRARCSRRR
jgi:hypothetical protein